MSGRVLAPEVHIKQPDENRVYTMNFASLLGSATIASVTSATATKVRGPANTGEEASTHLPNLPSPTNDTTTVSVRVQGGLHRQDYRLEFKVVDTDGNTLECDGILRIRDE